MKQVFHKTISMLMAFVVLFSTMSFTVDMHYCGDTLVETALFQKAKGCGMEMENPSTEGCAITKKNCCNDEQLVLEGQNELKLPVDKISFEQHVFIASFVYTYINLFEGIDNKADYFQDYRAPLVISPLYKLDESYLI